MKVTLISEAVWPERKGGLERWYDAISRYLAGNGHEVIFLNSTSVTEHRNGVNFLSVVNESWQYIGDGKRSKLQALKFGISIFRWLRKQDRQVVYCSSVPIISVLAAALVPKKTLIIEWFEIWTLQYWIRYSGIFMGFIGWLIQLIALQVGDYRLVYSERGLKSVKRLGRLNRRRIEKMPGLCPSEEPRAVLQVKDKRDDFCFLGRFVSEKQPLLAIKLAEKFRETGWKGQLWLLGTGPLHLDLLKYIESNQLQHYVKVIENPEDGEVLRVMNQCCALLHLSRREGFGLAPVEAAYRGLPTILIDYFDNAAVELGICPALIARGDSFSELISKMKLALANQDKYRLETLAWSESARKNKSIDTTLKRIEEIVKSRAEIV